MFVMNLRKCYAVTLTFYVYCMQLAICQYESKTGKGAYLVEAVQGRLAQLPCDITPPESGDKMHILIWYKDKSAIYTFDSRERQLEQGKHWSDESVLGGRAYFRYQDEPAKLTLDNVKAGDAGMYQCRVDFRRSPTRNVNVNLTVIVPPEKLIVLNEKGVQIPHYILGPYNEGVFINITCVAFGGRPSPRVTWWQENALLDNSYEYLTETKVRNVLYMERLERKHLHSVFTCQASNNNLIAPVSTSVTLDINLKPLWVKMVGNNKPLSAGITYEISCEVVGSRPAPTITWWKGGQLMIDMRETTSPDGNTTTSVLTFTPSVDDGGKYLSCRGQQPIFSNSIIEDGWNLEIYHAPLVVLELGSNLDANAITEGADVYFECNIKSNPWVYKVGWKHNGKMIYNNGGAGIIVSNQSLVLQNVNRARAGNYTCIGSNREGSGESNFVKLDVKFTPVCKANQQRLYNIGRNEGVLIQCELEANPTEIQFSWKFNNSDNSALMKDMAKKFVISNETKSTILYTPLSEQDYGTLLCRGSNRVGRQHSPCIFHIHPAGKPDPLKNCSVTNQTVESLQVECVEGFDGGLSQVFIMEVYDAHVNTLIKNVTSKTPVFFIDDLDSNTDLHIAIFASNKRGRSEIRELETFTLKSFEKRSASITAFAHLTPLLGILVGVVVALILVATIIVVVLRLRSEDDAQYDGESISAYAVTDSKNTSTEPLRTVLDGSTNSLEEKNPDIIPQNNSDDDYLEEEKAFDRLNNIHPRTYMALPNTNQSFDVDLDINRTSPRLYYNQHPSAVLQNSTLQRLHHPHFMLPAYISRPTRDTQHVYDGSITSATPLISREHNPIFTTRPDSRTPLVDLPSTHVVTRF